MCHIKKENKVLLIRKSRGFGKGKWNAPGGKLKEGEDPKRGAIREVEEETGLRISALDERGKLTFYFGEKGKPDWIVHVFECLDFEGSTRSGDEGSLKWFHENEIPYEDMWEDDKHWLPLLLSGETFTGHFWFDEEAESLLSFSLDADTTTR